MKTTKILMVVMVIAVTLFVCLPNLSWAAEDGAALYKAKCAACHGADATGKPTAKIPSLVGPETKALSDTDLTDAIANGGKAQKASHAFAKKGLTEDQIKALVTYVRGLQK